MEDRRSKYIKLLVTVIISGACMFYGWNLCEKNHIDVPGTVIGKSEFLKSRRSRSEWVLAIKPDNSKYRPYEVCVNFATYSTYNIGSHVTFNIMSSEADPNGHNDFLGIVVVVLGLIGCVVAFSMFYDLIH